MPTIIFYFFRFVQCNFLSSTLSQACRCQTTFLDSWIKFSQQSNLVSTPGPSAIELDECHHTSSHVDMPPYWSMSTCVLVHQCLCMSVCLSHFLCLSVSEPVADNKLLCQWTWTPVSRATFPRKCASTSLPHAPTNDRHCPTCRRSQPTDRAACGVSEVSDGWCTETISGMR